MTRCHHAHDHDADGPHDCANELSVSLTGLSASGFLSARHESGGSASAPHGYDHVPLQHDGFAGPSQRLPAYN